MVKIKIILTVSLSVLLISCAQRSGNTLIFPKSLNVNGDRWEVYELLGKSYAIHVAGDYLIVRNDEADTKLTAIDLTHKKLIAHFGFRGEGPSELINPGPILTNSTSFSVYDGGKKSLLKYELLDISDEESPTPSMSPIDVDGIISLASLSDSLFVASGVFFDGRLCLLDYRGNTIGWHGDYPISIDNNIPFHVLGIAYQSAICTKPNDSRIALATRYGGILQVFEQSPVDETIVEIGGVNLFSPELTTRDINGTPNFSPTQNTKWGYLSVVSTHELIFALYSGKIQQESNFYSGNQVHVFDWDGNPYCQINLDCEGISLAIEENRLLLLSDSDSGYDIIEYDLTNL